MLHHGKPDVKSTATNNPSLQKQKTATFGSSPETSPTKANKKKEAECKLIRERLGVDSIEDVAEIIIQLQGYTGAATVNAASNQDSNTKQQLRFKDIYRYPEVIGQGAYGLVIKVEKISQQMSKTPKSHNFQNQQTQSFTIAAKAIMEEEQLLQSLDQDFIKQPSPQYVAVKVINKRELNDGGYQVLKNEALILKEMNHPNIVKFYDIFETNDFIFIEMEFIPNGTLKNMMHPDDNKKKKRFTDYEASQIIGGLLSAVEHVHSKNYVHRDLKPDNVLIGDPKTGLNIYFSNQQQIEKENQNAAKLLETSELRRSIKLADFGLSASFRISQAHSLDERMGTLLFMAPEQTKSQNYGKKIDIWAVGIILYLLVEGKHPLYVAGQDTAQTYHEKLIKCNPALLASEQGGGKHLSPMARDIFTKLCNPMPIERYTAEQALRHPWITRDFSAPIPQTESQKVREVQAESILRNALNITFFLSVAKLRRNFPSVEIKNSQKSTSSSITSGNARHFQADFNMSEYMARCNQVIIETSERDRLLQQQREETVQRQLSPERFQIEATVSEGDEKIDNFDETKSQSSPQPISSMRKAAKKKQQLFDFNSSNLKKPEEQAKNAQQQASTVPQSSLNSTTIKRVSTFVKKQNVNQSGNGSQQPQVVKKANIHYQQLFADSSPQDDNQLPGSIISAPQQQLLVKRKSQFMDDTAANGPKTHSPPVKRNNQNSSQGKRKNKNKGMGAHNQTVEDSLIDDNQEESLYGRSPDTFRNNEDSSPNTVQVKRKHSGLNIAKNGRQLGNKFHLNLQAIEKPEPQSDFDRINKTPVEIQRKNQGDSNALIQDDLDAQATYTNKQPLRTSKSKNQKRRLVEASHQPEHVENDLLIGYIKQGGADGNGNFERQSSTDIQRLLQSQQKAKQLITNPTAFQTNGGGSSLKKKRTVINGYKNSKLKKMTDLNQIQDNVQFLNGDFDDFHNLSFEQQNTLVQQTGDFGSNSFNIEDRQLSLQQNKAQLKIVLQSKLSRHNDGGGNQQDFSLPQIVPNSQNEVYTNRRGAPNEDWSLIKSGALSTQKKQPNQQLKGQRSLENSGQRTHNYFFNQPHSLIQNQAGFQLMEGLDMNLLVNQQHSFVQQSSNQIQQQQLTNNQLEVRRQSTNFSAIDGGSHGKKNLSLFQQEQQLQQQYAAQNNQTQQHPAVANFDFLQFQQKYIQWKEQRQSMAAQKSEEPPRTVVKQSLSKFNQIESMQQQSSLQTEPDDFMLMAALGAAGLKPQRSSANVAMTQNQNLQQKFNQDSGDIEVSPQKYQLDALNYQMQTKTPLLKKGSMLETNNAPVQLHPHQIRLEDQLKALIAGNPQGQSSIQPIKLGSKLPMHLKNVQVVKEVNSNIVQPIHSTQTQNQQKTNQNMVEGQAISHSMPPPQQQSHNRNRKRTIANQQQATNNQDSQQNMMIVCNNGGDQVIPHQNHAINMNTAKVQVVPAKIQVIVQTTNNPKQLQIQKKTN